MPVLSSSQVKSCQVKSSHANKALKQITNQQIEFELRPTYVMPILICIIYHLICLSFFFLRLSDNDRACENVKKVRIITAGEIKRPLKPSVAPNVHLNSLRAKHSTMLSIEAVSCLFGAAAVQPDTAASYTRHLNMIILTLNGHAVCQKRWEDYHAVRTDAILARRSSRKSPLPLDRNPKRFPKSKYLPWRTCPRASSL